MSLEPFDCTGKLLVNFLRDGNGILKWHSPNRCSRTSYSHLVLPQPEGPKTVCGLNFDPICQISSSAHWRRMMIKSLLGSAGWNRHHNPDQWIPRPYRLSLMFSQDPLGRQKERYRKFSFFSSPGKQGKFLTIKTFDSSNSKLVS